VSLVLALNLDISAMREVGELALPDGLPRSRVHAMIIVGLLALFLFRVAAQLLQLFAPTALLPPFAAWHSATLPYPVLVAAQFVIILVSAWFARGLWLETIRKSRRVGRILGWLGAVYFFGSVARFIAGFTFARDNAFLAAHLPGFFHIVLSAMVLTAAHFHLSGGNKQGS
jgi:ABC-type multidrug transport system fused ATPase/permease subunit